MARSRKRKRRRSLFALLLLLLLLLLWKLNPFLAGVLPGGGTWLDEPERDEEKPGTLEVLVVDESERAPVMGATVRLAGLDGDRHSSASDREGRVRFEGLLAQPYRIDAEGEGQRASAWSVPGKSVTMRMRGILMRTGVIKGRDGRPRSGKALLLDGEARILAETDVGADGRFRLPDLRGALCVSAEPDDGPPGGAFFGDIALGDARAVRGRIPVPGATRFEVVGLTPDFVEDRLVPFRTRWSADPEGNYEGRLPRISRAWIVHEGAPYPVGVTAPVRASAAIEGRVIDIGSRPLAGIEVGARPLDDGLPLWPFPHAVTTKTGSDGKFRLAPLGAGSYSLELDGAGRARMYIAKTETGRDPLTIVMTRGFKIRGTVVDPDGKPIEFARVYALATPDPDSRYPELSTRTTSDGRFVLDRIGGEYARVRVERDGFRGITMLKVAPNANPTIPLRRK